MDATVVTTVTTTIALPSFDITTQVDVNDQNGLSVAAGDGVMMTAVVGSLRSTIQGIREQYPSVDQALLRNDDPEIDRLRQMIRNLGFCPHHAEPHPCGECD